jgi:uncharacterized protein (TIGR02147 family)
MKHTDEKLSIYNYLDYKLFIKHVISSSQPKRGALSQLAKHAGCQASYLSQALKGKVHLSSDQVFGIGRFLGQSEEETEYFLALLNYARASGLELRARIKSQLEGRKHKMQKISKHLEREKSVLPEMDHAFYYSSWTVAAIHVCTDIPSLREPETIAKYLQVPEVLVLATLKRLESMGLVLHEGSKWIHSGKQSHVDRQSPFFNFHLENFHQQARVASQSQNEGTQFSGIYAVSEETFHAMKEGALAVLKRMNGLALSSASERVACFNIDLFWLR